MVMHWNTVIMAKKMLSKLIIPPCGPSQPRHPGHFSSWKQLSTCGALGSNKFVVVLIVRQA